jgi:3-keto-disaccharide hydrolase
MRRPVFPAAAFILWIIALAVPSLAQEKHLFNGKNLDGWEGNPESWSVQDGAITGVTTDEKRLPYNQFLIWRGGADKKNTVKNFELTAKVKQSGNNSGIQYRSKELPSVGPWSVGGYQCDIHPIPANNAMLYDERGRGIVAQNGQTVIIDREGTKWLVKETEPVKVDVAEWNEYTIIARGNHLIHKVNGQVTADVIDHQESEREDEGIVAIQIHQGPAMKVQVKDIVLKELPDGGVLTPEQAPVPADAKKIAAPPAKKKKS